MYNGIRLTKAARPKRGPGLSRKADRELYDALHQAWRAGAIDDFYFGRRSPADPTVVWRIDSHEWDGSERAKVADACLAALDRRGIVDVTFGEPWCGFTPVVVTYVTGRVLTESWDGLRKVVA